MSNYRPSGFGSSMAQANAAALDQGLRAYMLSIYNYMAIGVAITGLAAYLFFTMSVTSDPSAGVARIASNLWLTDFGRTLYVTPLKYVIMIAPIGLVFLLGFKVQSMAVTTAQAVFWLYAALVGVSLATIGMIYTGQSIARTFFITAATFGALSLYGYTTKRSLSGMGSFLMMGLFGLIIASLVNIFMQSSALQFAISVIGVLVFAGLTAYDTQRLKDEYVYGVAGADRETTGRAAIMGALTLYLDFINLFVMLMQLLGQRRD